MRRQDFQNNLPKLNTGSLSRFRTVSKGHSRTEEMKNKQQSKMLTLKQQNSTSYASKVIKYETSGVIYLKKKQEQQIQLRSIQQEIKSIQKQLEQRRGQSINQAKNMDKFVIDYKLGSDKQDEDDNGIDDNKKKKRRRRIINLNDLKEVKLETEKALKTIQQFKKQVNTMKSQNTLIHAEVNKYRKQINTIKEHLANITRDLQKQDDIYESMMEENKAISLQVAKKHLELHQKRSEKAHEQTKKLKKYDQILKSITRQIEDDKIKTFTKPAFYMTEINYSQIKSPTKSPGKRSHSPSKRRLNIPLHELQFMLHSYQEQFEKIKQEAGTDDWQKIGQQYTQHQKQTYAVYRFSNGLSEELKDKLQLQQKLKSKLQQVKSESVFKYSSSRQIELDEVSRNLQITKKNNQRYRSDLLMCERVTKDLKLSIPVMIDRLRMTVKEYPELGEFNLNKLEQKDLVPLLIIIQKRKDELMEINDNFESRNMKLSQHEVEEQIQNAKKQFALFQKSEILKGREVENKYQKFLDHSELVKTIDITSKSRKDKRKN